MIRKDYSVSKRRKAARRRVLSEGYDPAANMIRPRDREGLNTDKGFKLDIAQRSKLKYDDIVARDPYTNTEICRYILDGTRRLYIWCLLDFNGRVVDRSNFFSSLSDCAVNAGADIADLVMLVDDEDEDLYRAIEDAEFDPTDSTRLVDYDGDSDLFEAVSDWDTPMRGGIDWDKMNLQNTVDTLALAYMKLMYNTPGEVHEKAQTTLVEEIENDAPYVFGQDVWDKAVKKAFIDMKNEDIQSHNERMRAVRIAYGRK